MVSYLGRLAALAALVAPIFAAPAPAGANLKIRNLEARDIVKDSYIVVYQKDISAAAFTLAVEEVKSLTSKREVGGIGATFDIGSFKGYQITADAATLGEIVASPDVSYPHSDTGIRLTLAGCLR